MRSTPEQAAAYRKHTRWAAKRYQGYQVLRNPRICLHCRRKMLYWVKRLGGCFACSVEQSRSEHAAI